MQSERETPSKHPVDPEGTHREEEPLAGAEGSGGGSSVAEAEPVSLVPFTMNQVVAYNLMRARRQSGWTQEECAERLTKATGKQWTNATLSAAERSWRTERVREFNANELVAFATIFQKPVASFLTPIPPTGSVRHVYVTRRLAEGDELPSLATLVKSDEWMDDLRVLGYTLPLHGLERVLAEDVNRLLYGRLVWTPIPNRMDWWRPEEDVEEQGEDSSESAASGGERNLNELPAGVAAELVAQELVRIMQEKGLRFEQIEQPPF
ncbi:hypothetical protein ACFV0H_07490 [Streptomyces erythrochromogenes]|uniref:hypothetical protein n=1 Tax=Streptomyces erythrochromogenes TaxID=285574 RepID=UPI00367CF5E0